jgi:RND family efflux transporter MFP subunit
MSLARLLRVRRLGLPLIGAALTLLGCQDAPSQAAAPVASGARPAPARAVKVTPATEQMTDQRVSATGTLAADEQVVLGTKVAGRVTELPVDLGSRLQRGQVVARLDPTDARLRVDQSVAALQQARARLGLSPEGTDDRVNVEQTALVKQARAVLDEAKLTRERSERLQQQGLIAQAQLDTAISGLAVAEGRYEDSIEEVRNRQAVLLQRRSELELARQQLVDTVVASPIDGAVSERRASVGEFLAAGAPVATIVKLHPLRLRLAVPERESTSVRVGQSVVVTVEGVAGEHKGRVARVSPSISEQNRTLLIEAEVPNEGSALRPGAFAKAEIVLAGGVRVITVPATAVVTFAGVEKVLTVDKDKAAERRVQTGRRLGDRVEIVAGLPAGTPVVTQPGNLTTGQPVTVEP